MIFYNQDKAILINLITAIIIDSIVKIGLVKKPNIVPAAIIPTVIMLNSLFYSFQKIINNLFFSLVFFSFFFNLAFA